jgi:hypothetical protein
LTLEFASPASPDFDASAHPLPPLSADGGMLRKRARRIGMSRLSRNHTIAPKILKKSSGYA